MLAVLRLRYVPISLIKCAHFASVAQSSKPSQQAHHLKESRWQRLKRLRKTAPTPPNRTKHQFDRHQTYDLPTALSHVRAAKWANFDESLEFILRLNIDPRRADQNLRGSIPIPHGTGRPDRVIVFAEEEQADAAIAAGADLVGGDQLIETIKEAKGKNVRGFAAAVAMPHLLPLVASQVGRIMGPKGLMPSDKNGTVVSDVSDVVKRIKRGWLSYRTDKDGNIHMNIGKLSFDDAKLTDNLTTAMRGILDVRPTTIKKRFLIKAFICSSMGPSVELDLEDLAKRATSFPDEST